MNFLMKNTVTKGDNMQVIENINACKKLRRTFSGTLGFVPTMGALHAGHVSLIECARQENNLVMVSIFVNPLQFNDEKDFQSYPDTLISDKDLLESLAVDYVLVPQQKDIYPLQSKFTITTDHVFANCMEGKCRPGHFEGVLTVVLKLLNIVSPDKAYFGEKDFQQYMIIKSMVDDLFLDVEIVACPIICEQSGLPLSSRNSLLSVKQKQLAELASIIIHEINFETLADCKNELVSLGVKIEYLEIKDGRVFSAIRIAGIRLIDNFSL